MRSRLVFRERSNTKPNLSALSVTAVKETSVKILLLEACRRKKRSRKTPFILRKTGIILSRAQGETDGEIPYNSFHLSSDLLNINPFVPCRFGKCLWRQCSGPPAANKKRIFALATTEPMRPETRAACQSPFQKTKSYCRI